MSAPRWPRLVGAFLLAFQLGEGLGAQAVRPGALVGRVLDAAGGYVQHPIVRVSRGAKTIVTEGEGDGDFLVEGLSAGRWNVSVRRSGFRTAVVELDIPAGGLRRDFTLNPLVPALDSTLVASGWRGVRGSVSDARSAVPLVGASLRLLGTNAAASSDSVGRFAIPLAAERDFIVRVERTGYSTRLLTGRTPEAGYLELEAVLDTSEGAGNENLIWRDLELRLKFATPRAARITRHELEETRAITLGSALEASRTMSSRGLRVTRGACLFVDGRPRPGFTVEAVVAEDVEFVEVYPVGTDLTRTLASRWPTGATCGDGGERVRDDRRSAQFVAVWFRAP